MDKATLSNLIDQSKRGNRKAAEQLLIYAHTPVLYLCRKILKDVQLSEDTAEHVLRLLVKQIDHIANAEHLRIWLGNTTAACCMRKRSQFGAETGTDESTNVVFPSKELSKAETAQVVQILADALPEEYRICLLLSACCEVGTKNIAQMTGFSEEAVTQYLAQAEYEIQKQMQQYQSQGVVFAGFHSVALLLRSAMFLKKNRSAAGAMVKKILPPVSTETVLRPRRSNPLIKVLACVAVTLVILLALLIWGVVRNKVSQEMTNPTQSDAAPSTEILESTIVTTQAVTEPVTEESTLPETTAAAKMIQETVIPETTVPQVTQKPAVNTGGTASSTATAPKPSESTEGNPGQGADGHTHNFISIPSTAPSCTRSGQVYRICTICHWGIVKSDPVNYPPLGHDYYANIVVPPTTTNKGYTVYTCSRCGDNYDADFVDPLPAPTQPPVVETQPPVVETQAQLMAPESAE